MVVKPFSLFISKYKILSQLSLLFVVKFITAIDIHYTNYVKNWSRNCTHGLTFFDDQKGGFNVGSISSPLVTKIVIFFFGIQVRGRS